MATCGLWRTRRHLVAVVADGDGWTAAPLVARENDDGLRLLDLVDAHHGLDCVLVVPELLSEEQLVTWALEREQLVLAAPSLLVDAIARAAGISTAARMAALLARLPEVRGFRAHLRRVERRRGHLRLL